VSRRLKVVLSSLAVLCGVGALAFLLLFPKLGSSFIRSRVLPRLESRLGRAVDVGHIDVRWGRVVLAGVKIRGAADAPDAPLVSVTRVVADYDTWAALRGELRLGTVAIDEPRLRVTRAADGTDNFSDLVARLRGPETSPAGAPAGGPHLRPARVEVRGGAVVATDDSLGVRAGIDQIDGFLPLDPPGRAHLVLAEAHADHRLGPRLAGSFVVEADPRDPRATLAITVSEGSVTVWPKLSLTGIFGTVQPGAEPGRVAIALHGGYGGADVDLWKAEGWLDPSAKSGAMKLSADRFTLDKIEKVLVDTPIQAPENTAVDAALDLRLEGGVLSFAGGLQFSGLTLFHPMLSDDPVHDLGFRGSVRGHYALGAKVLTLDEADLTFRGVEARVDGEAALLGGLDADGQPRAARRVRAHIAVAPVPCQTALDALPREVTPRLQGFKLSGSFSADLRLDVDWANLDALDLGGTIGIWGCTPVGVPEDMSKERLLGEFEHVVEVEENDFRSFQVGPSNPDFVPLAEVSPYLTNSLMTTEDAGFMKHRGFITREFRSALIKDLKEGYFKYGASSITMQLVKNVFLYRQKTLARKLQELFLTWYVETVLPKERLLEMYVNVIEFGPGIYGIGPAARHYFGKAAKDLGPAESAFFSSILPNPKGRYLQYCKGELTKWGDAKIQRILKLEHDRGLLSDEELATALSTPLAFDRSEALPEEECVRQTRLMIERTRSTSPGGKPAASAKKRL
jgi:hypothetical protein